MGTEKVDRKLFRSVYCKGEQRNKAVSGGRRRVKRVLSFLRWEITISLCLMGTIQKRGCNCWCGWERLHLKELPSEQERGWEGELEQRAYPGGLTVFTGEKVEEVGTGGSGGGSVWKVISDSFCFLSERRSKERKVGKKLLVVWEERKSFKRARRLGQWAN